MSDAPTQDVARILAGQDEAKLINAFFVLYKNARILESNNPTYQKQLDDFCQRLTDVGEMLGETIIKIHDGRYFINERMVKFDDTGNSGAFAIVAEWKTIGLGGIDFQLGISSEELDKFIRFISSVKPSKTNIDELIPTLKEIRLDGIKLLSAKQVTVDQPTLPDEVRKQFRSSARSTFFKAMSVVEEVLVNTQHNRDINVSKTKRVVHTLIDHITRDESSLIELSAIKDYDDYTYAHSTNVCVYALTLGVRLGFDRARLSQLGFSALFHDVGKVKLPQDLIRKPDAYDENDWIQMQRHPLLGAKTILRNMKLDVHVARAARGAFEHHINEDFTGYPMLRYQKRPTTLFSKIISIVDTFDALSSGRIYIKASLSPDRVLKKMHYQMSSKFDPFLLRIFNDIIGIFPAGSLVLLSSDEIALVLTNNDTQKDRPYIKIVGNRDGLLQTPLWVDLSQAEHAHRKIVRLIDPSRYGLDVKDFILDS